MITYKRKPISLKTRKLQLFPLQNDPCASFKCIFSGKMLKVKQRHSQQLSPQKDQLTLRKEKILLIQLLQHLSRSHLPMFCPNVTSRIRYGAAWEKNLRLYEYTLPHLHDPEQKRSYIWQGQALFPDFC
ncbi:uncharacterized protein [Apostichopus japonicus]|uniref:uncharacterized protein isoform X1 n=1 Tax=Stichopus japonicus TaxID=307972 RepID=UPI003AB8ED35